MNAYVLFLNYNYHEFNILGSSDSRAMTCIYILRIPDTIPPQILHRAALGGVFSSLVAGCVQSRPASDGLRSSNNFTEDF